MEPIGESFETVKEMLAARLDRLHDVTINARGSSGEPALRTESGDGPAGEQAAMFNRKAVERVAFGHDRPFVAWLPEATR